MKFCLKTYKTSKTKKYIKNNNFFFFFNGVNQNSNGWIKTEKELIRINLNYYKVFNRITLKTLKNSIFSNIKGIVNGLTFFVKPNLKKNILIKTNLINNLKLLLFILLAIKFNNKIYSLVLIKHLIFIEYSNTKLIFYKFNKTKLKISK